MVQFILKASVRTKTEVDLRKYIRCIYNMQMICLRLVELLNYKAGSKWVPRQLGTFRHRSTPARARTQQKYWNSYHGLSEYVQGTVGGRLHLDNSSTHYGTLIIRVYVHFASGFSMYHLHCVSTTKVR